MLTESRSTPAAQSIRIGELAHATGVSAETIRFYEREGVLPTPARGTSKYRLYSSDDVERLTFVRTSRELGFTIAEVRALLALAESAGQSCADVDALARRHLAQVEEKLRQLELLREELTRVIGTCQGGATIVECRILQALGGRASRSVRSFHNE